jgi:hypothetical protein
MVLSLVGGFGIGNVFVLVYSIGLVNGFGIGYGFGVGDGFAKWIVLD